MVSKWIRCGGWCRGHFKMGIRKVEVVCRCWKRLVVERVDWVDFYWLVSFDLVVGVGGPLCRESVLFCQVGFFLCGYLRAGSQRWVVEEGILCLAVLVAFAACEPDYIVAQCILDNLGQGRVAVRVGANEFAESIW